VVLVMRLQQMIVSTNGYPVNWDDVVVCYISATMLPRIKQLHVSHRLGMEIGQRVGQGLSSRHAVRSFTRAW